MNLRSKNGVAIMVVLIFAFSVAIIMFVMASSNTNLAFQNKQTLYQMQTYYLAHSGMQHAKLRLRLLPKEIHDFFKPVRGNGNPFMDVDSTMFPPTNLGNYKPAMAKFNLFNPQSAPDEAFPYGGRYHVESIELQGSHDGMRLAQDNYVIEVHALTDNGTRKVFETSLTEELTVSRFTGGIK